MSLPMNMDEERRRQAKAEADSLIAAGKITTDAELDAFMASKGVKPRAAAPVDATSVQPIDFEAKFPGARQMKFGEGVLREGASAWSAGATDRMIPAVASLLEGIPYDSARTRFDAEKKRYQAEAPGSALLANAVGGMTPWGITSALFKGAAKVPEVLKVLGPLAKNTAPARIARGTAALGADAAAGGATAVGMQDGEADNDPEQTKRNFVVGSLFGTAVPMGIRAVGKGGTAVANLAGVRAGGHLDNAAVKMAPLPGQSTMNPLNPQFFTRENARNLGRSAAWNAEGILFPQSVQRYADNQMVRLLTNEGEVPLTEAAQRYANQQAATGTAKLLDIGGDPMLRTMRNARSGNAQAGQRLHESLGARRASLTEDLDQDISKAMGGRVNINTELKTQGDNLRAQANAAYKPVYPRTVSFSDDIKTALANDPHGLWEAAWEAGRVSALREDPKRAFKPLFGRQKQYMPVEGGDFGLPSATQGDPTMLRDATIEDIDIIKRGMDVIINNKNDAKYSQMRRDGANLSGWLKRMLKEADDQVPEYGAARRTYGDLAEQKGAFEAGAQGVDNAFMQIPSFMNARSDDVRTLLGDLSDPAARQYMRGAAQDLFRVNENNSVDALSRLAASNKSATRRKLEAGFDRIGKPEKFDDFVNTVNLRDQQRKNANFIEGGSQTADKLVDQIEGAELPYSVGQFTYAPGRTMAAWMAKQGLRQTSKGLADATIARGILGGDDAAQYLAYLERYAEALQKRGMSRKAALKQASSVIGGFGPTKAAEGARALFGIDRENY